MYKKWKRKGIIFIGIVIFIYVIIQLVLAMYRSASPEATLLSKSSLAAFNAPETLITKLADNGIGNLEQWKGYDEGIYMASSSYFQIGSPGKNGISNQLSYAVMGNDKSYVNNIEIILILNNKDTIATALNLFSAVTAKTFDDIHVALPAGLIDAMAIPRKFSYDSGGFHIKFFDKWNGLTEWHLSLSADTTSL